MWYTRSGGSGWHGDVSGRSCGPSLFRLLQRYPLPAARVVYSVVDRPFEQLAQALEGATPSHSDSILAHRQVASDFPESFARFDA
jgi:hypothetical protein